MEVQIDEDDGPAIEAEHARLGLVQAALEGLEDLANGRVLDDKELDQVLSAACPGP